MFFKVIVEKILSFIVLIIFLPFIMLILFSIFLSDFSNPIYISDRVCKDSKKFKLFKIRSMIKNASSTGVTSTSNNDNRITPLGKYIRKFKFDEILQLINVIIGDMSLVGPRPQIESEVKLYSDFEKGLLSVKPGITDFSSIIFSDEGEILKNSSNPNKDYNDLIRPWKSKYGIFYIKHMSLKIDIILIFLTILSIFNRKLSLNLLSNILKKKGAEASLIEIAKEKDP